VEKGVQVASAGVEGGGWGQGFEEESFEGVAQPDGRSEAEKENDHRSREKVLLVPEDGAGKTEKDVGGGKAGRPAASSAGTHEKPASPSTERLQRGG
jgi:hypothetical protein